MKDFILSSLNIKNFRQLVCGICTVGVLAVFSVGTVKAGIIVLPSSPILETIHIHKYTIKNKPNSRDFPAWIISNKPFDKNGKTFVGVGMAEGIFPNTQAAYFQALRAVGSHVQTVTKAIQKQQPEHGLMAEYDPLKMTEVTDVHLTPNIHCKARFTMEQLQPTQGSQEGGSGEWLEETTEKITMSGKAYQISLFVASSNASSSAKDVVRCTVGNVDSLLTEIPIADVYHEKLPNGRYSTYVMVTVPISQIPQLEENGDQAFEDLAKELAKEQGPDQLFRDRMNRHFGGQGSR